MALIETIPHVDGAQRITELRLSRAPVNALNPELCLAIRGALDAAVANGTDGVLLSAAAREGTAVFSAGIDVPHLLSLGADRAGLRAGWDAFMDAARALAESPVPVAVAIAGHAPAGGCVLALCCDWRVMARSADPERPYRIGLNETQVGLAVPAGIQTLLRRVVGPRVAERMLVAGEMPTAEQAFERGMVDELADLESVNAQALAWLGRTLGLPREAVQRTRALARADLRAAFEPANLSLDAFIDDWYSPGTQGALQALVARLGR